MTHEQRYLFDLQGFLVVDDVLTGGEVAELNAALDALDLWEEGKRRGSEHVNEFKMHIGPVLEWGEAFRRLIDHAGIVPYLRELLGEGLRLDHEYGIFMREGAPELRLHGGATPYDPAQYYHFRNERMYCGLTVVSYALADAGPGDGGFCCIPGSHKSNVACPPAFKSMERTGPWLAHVPQKAGSALIFTEALTHGTLPWKAAHERRSLLFKYSPGHQSWAKRYLTGPSLEGFTDVQQRLLEPPYHGRREAVFREEE